jgi:hypothetical protein
MRIVVALSGNALLRRGEPLDVKTQRYNVRRAALAHEHQLIVTHGNGPEGRGRMSLRDAWPRTGLYRRVDRRGSNHRRQRRYAGVHRHVRRHFCGCRRQRRDSTSSFNGRL